MQFLKMLAVIVFVSAGAGQAAQAASEIKATDAWRQAQAGKLTIVDVRSPGEWRETGVAKGAWKVTIHGPQKMEGFLKEIIARTNGDRSRRIALICATGVRSDYALRYLQKNGYKNVTHIAEGMMGRSAFRGGGKGWLKHGLPVSKN